MNKALYSIRSVQRVCDILDLIQSHPGGLSLGACAAATDLPKSSVFRYLATLESRGYVEHTEKAGYLLGMALSGDRIDILVRRLLPKLIQLRDQFGESVNLGMLDGSRVAYLEVIESKSSIRNAPQAIAREFVHCTALGKVLASTLSDDEVRAILEAEGMPAITGNTITDMPAYFAELAATRARGYAVDDQENETSVACIAVNVPGTKLRIAVSLSAPISRFSMDDAESVAETMKAVISQVPDLVNPQNPIQ